MAKNSKNGQKGSKGIWSRALISGIGRCTKYRPDRLKPLKTLKTLKMGYFGQKATGGTHAPTAKIRVFRFLTGLGRGRPGDPKIQQIRVFVRQKQSFLAGPTGPAQNRKQHVGPENMWKTWKNTQKWPIFQKKIRRLIGFLQKKGSSKNDQK